MNSPREHARIYNSVIASHFKDNRQMMFIAGPRQVGKTTLGTHASVLSSHYFYFNWDHQLHRQYILLGPQKIAEIMGADKILNEVPIVVFDEIHKYARWKLFLKGFFDTYPNIKIIVTGSSRLDIFKAGGDSLMGRYFYYRLHPFSVGEIVRAHFSDQLIQNPVQIASVDFDRLFQFGGFPEPYLRADTRFYNRWISLRKKQLFREDLRDLSRIQELDQITVLAELLKQQSSQLVNYSALANKVNVSVGTIKRWLITLESFYYCFRIQPWSKNISRSLLKEPKLFLWDWSMISDPGPKYENFVASHLLKAVHFWSDLGMGEFGLYFLRDKEKREVDFLVTQNNMPWILVEAKTSQNRPLSKSLLYFRSQINAPHAFQVALDMDYIHHDVFDLKTPKIVPAQTFLSQLI